MADYSTLDAALETLGAYGPDLANGLTSHAPMVAEALAALGRAEAVLPWIDGYRPGMLPAPTARAPIDRDDWRGVLGRDDRVVDWFAFFERELGEASSWRAVLDRWIPRLAPAACASATHGLIRTGHAVRSLVEQETALRRRELAHGLGYWAASFQTLPVGSLATRGMGVRDAVRHLPVVPPAERVFTGTIVSSLVGLSDFAPFAAVAGMLDLGDDLDAALCDLTEAFSEIVVAHAHDTLTAIVFVHGVTSLTAIRSLLAEVPEGTARDLVRFGWQTSAALYVTFAAPVSARVDLGGASPSIPDLVGRAIACADDHAIKFTEACVREHARRPRLVFLAAAEHALGLLASS